MGKDIFSKKSRFSIRKLNIGVCSVLLGTLIMIGHTAQADETTSDGATVAATSVSTSQGEGVVATTSPSTAPESATTATVAPAATETVTATSVVPTSSVASSVVVSSEAPASTSATSSASASTAPASTSATSSAPASTAPASTSATSSAPTSSAATSSTTAVALEVTGSTNVSTAKPATASEASRSVTASTASSTTASSVSTSANNVTVSETANVPRVRSRRAVGQERSMEGRDIKYVYQNRSAQVNSGTPTQRAKIEYRQLDDYEVVDGKTVATDPSGQGRPVLEWTVTFNEAQYDRMGGYYYFTIPKNVSDPYNVVTDYDGAYVDRDGWKDANKESGAGSANAEGVQYVDAGNKLEWRVKNTVGRDYNNVDGLSGVMGDTKKVYVLQLSNSSSARKFTIKYRTIVEDSSQVISYIAGVESKTGLPRNNWYAISGKYDKNLVSQVATPNVTPNLTDTSVNVPVQTVASTSSTLSGTGIPGAKIKLYIDGREQNIGNVTVDSSGNWTTGELPTALNNNQGEGTTIKPRQTVQVTQTVDGTESSRRTVPVSIGETTVEPSSLTTNQDAVVAGQKEVTLKVPHDAGIAYLRYTNTAGQTVEIPVKRDNLSAAWTSQKPEAATVKSVENGKFQDTIVLTMADKIAGTEVAAISNVVEGGFSSVAGWQPRGVENQAPTIESAVEGNQKTVAQGAQLDLASLVTVADKEDDAQATLGDKVHAEVISVNGNAGTKTVDTNTQGTYTVKYKAVDSQGKESGEIEVTVVVNPARQNEAPTVEIPYSNKDTKEVYVYGGEENSFDIKFKDDSGKIASATVKQGGNREFDPVTGEADTINTQYGFKANVITTETPATADAPAVITYRGTPAATDGLTQDRLTAATKGENPAGLPLGWRYATATDTDGALVENKAVGSSTATDPGAFRVVLKPQNQKYDVATPTEKVTVADPANVTEAELAKIKEKLQLEYSQNNDDANLADKKGTPADKTNKIQSVTKDADGNLVVTYADGSIDKKPLSEFVNVAPTVEIPYSNKDTKEVYVYGGEENSFDIKFKDDSGKIASATVKQGGNREFDPVTGEADTINTQYGFKANVITTETPATADAPAVITYRGTPAATDGLTQDRLTAATKGENPAGLPLGWRYATATDTDGALVENKAVGSSTATDPGAFRVVLKPQNQKYDVATPTEKVEVANPDNVTNDELNKIKEKLQLEYSQTNDDANLADKKGTTVADKTNKIQSVTKDADGNLVVTYTDGSTDKKPLSEFVTKDTTAPAKPEVKTDLTGKAGTKDPVEVSAEPGSTVELFDKDGNSLGTGVANDQGVATITPTKDIPVGNVTATATDPSGNTSDASEPKVATD
ncbi:YSIRK-type signal peptide-containing protein, partial [Streptococcus salivarius]|uniref:YSIRK-type signal peptide-containing protein n=1 Tax=Streptococcus salivarius TaxID=1304 RepID=UPI0039C12BC1